MTAESLTAMRELDSRVADGISVRLLWHQPDGRLFVAVADAKTGNAFAIEVRDRDRTREVFHHPYAYAAWYGIDTSAPAPASAETSISLAA
jgi:hypothetical protein